jgi:hypothetical protein
VAIVLRGIGDLRARDPGSLVSYYDITDIAVTVHLKSPSRSPYFMQRHRNFRDQDRHPPYHRISDVAAAEMQPGKLAEEMMSMSYAACNTGRSARREERNGSLHRTALSICYDPGVLGGKSVMRSIG